MRARPRRAVTSDPLDALLHLVAILEDLGLSYAIGGSVASSVHGEPRTSADADVIVSLSEERLTALLARLAGEYYVSAEAAAEALREHASFNVIHLRSMYKVDIFVAGPSALDRNQLRRRVSVQLQRDPPARAFVTAAEDIVLRKLDWYRRSAGASDRQWRDVLGVLKLRAGTLDLAYLHEAAAEAGLGRLLETALAQAGLAGQ